MFQVENAVMDSGECIEIEDHSFELPAQRIGHFETNEDVIIINDNEDGMENSVISDEIISTLIEMGLDHFADPELVNRFLSEAPDTGNKVNRVIETIIDRYSDVPPFNPEIIEVVSLKKDDVLIEQAHIRKDDRPGRTDIERKENIIEIDSEVSNLADEIPVTLCSSSMPLVASFEEATSFSNVVDFKATTSDDSINVNTTKVQDAAKEGVSCSAKMLSKEGVSCSDAAGNKPTPSDYSAIINSNEKQDLLLKEITSSSSSLNSVQLNNDPVASTSTGTGNVGILPAIIVENVPETHSSNDDEITDVLTQETIDVLKVLPNRNFDEVYAYLESHYYDLNRVDVVIAELKNATNDQKNNEMEENEIKIQNTWEMLKDLFPDADPDFLFDKAQECFGNPEGVDNLVSTLLDRKDYPKLTEILKEHESNTRKRKFIERNFSAEEFLEMYEDPISHFYDETNTPSQNYKSHAEIQLCNMFPKIYKKYILHVLRKHNFHFTPALRELETKFNPVESDSAQCSINSGAQCKRVKYSEKIFKKVNGPQISLPEEIDEAFYKELAFTEVEKTLRDKIKDTEEMHQLKLEQAKESNMLLTCSCCFDDEVLAEDILTCNEGHVFCKGCIKKSSEINIGERKTSFPCMASDCKGHFPLSVIKQVIKPVVFSKLLQLMQEEEIQQANIPDLVSCPFCSFSAIMSDPNDKIFRCMNPDCSKESCRLCKEPSHIPLRCEEVENSKETNMRTFIENKMSEKMLRKCYKCNRRFIKQGGCNKMTCTCGASMCYICQKPIKDYSHFTNGTCPQFSDDYEFLRTELQNAAEEARNEFVEDHPDLAGVELRHNPLQHLPDRTETTEIHPALFNFPPFNPNIFRLPEFHPDMQQMELDMQNYEQAMNNFFGEMDQLRAHNQNRDFQYLNNYNIQRIDLPAAQPARIQIPPPRPMPPNIPIPQPPNDVRPIVNYPPIVLNPLLPNLQNRPILRPPRFHYPFGQPIQIQQIHTVGAEVPNVPNNNNLQN